MRLLSLSSRKPTTTTLPAATAAVQTRCLSQAVLSQPRTTSAHDRSGGCCSAAAGAVVARTQQKSGVAVFQTQQTRGMKVRSAIKKRCEHCKVRELDWEIGWGLWNHA